MADNTRRNDLGDCMLIIHKRSMQNLLTGCMEWLGLVVDGYGSMRCDHKMKKVHRIVYEATYGAIPDGMHVLHACDNRQCCEPVHLFLGTNAENILDKVKKDRSGKKLCTEDARNIKIMLREGSSAGELSKIYGVHQSIISRIRTGKRWAHVIV